MNALLTLQIKRILFISLLISICSAGIIHADDQGVCGDSLTWTLDKKGALTISGVGPMQDFEKKKPWKENKIRKVIIDEGVTSIGKRAFKNCSNLTIISYPNSLKSLGDECFAGCYNLYVIVLHDGLEHIGQKAFSGCWNIETVVVPNTVRYVGSHSFQDCTNLSTLIVPDEPFEMDKDTILGIEDCKMISMVRAHHSLCPEYIKKYLSPECPFLNKDNPRRSYEGAIRINSTQIIPAIRAYTQPEALDSIEKIITYHFSISNPGATYDKTRAELRKFLPMLEQDMYDGIVQHYYDAFYEAGSNNDLDAATENAFKHLLLGGKEDEALMWDIIITKYGTEHNTNTTRFLLNRFRDISIVRDSAYTHTVDSLTKVYYDVLYPNELLEMQGCWISVNDSTTKENFMGAPEYIIKIADITLSNGSTILSSPKCDWSSKKQKDKWQNLTYDNTQLRYSYETQYNEETNTLRLLFNTQSKRIANAKMQHEALDMLQYMNASVSASLESFQNELNRGFTNNYINFGTWGANTLAGIGIGIGATIVVAALTYSILYASNIETAYKYEILLTPQTPKVMEASVRYVKTKYNYNNGQSKLNEDIKKLTFVKWEEADSVLFISNTVKPIFLGETLPTDSPLLTEFTSAKQKQAAGKLINKANMEKMRLKAGDIVLKRIREEKIEEEKNDADEPKDEVMYY